MPESNPNHIHLIHIININTGIISQICTSQWPDYEWSGDYMPCKGAEMLVNKNPTLFSVIGYQYSPEPVLVHQISARGIRGFLERIGLVTPKTVGFNNPKFDRDYFHLPNLKDYTWHS